MKVVRLKNLSSRKRGFHIRTIFRLGKMLVVSLPLFWSKNIEWLKESQHVVLELNSNDTITIRPIREVSKKVSGGESKNE